MTEELPLEKYVEAYVKVRDVIEEKKEELSSLREQLDTLTDKLLEFCNTENLDSVKTKTGTITRRVRTKYWTNDWSELHKFIKENDALHLLEARIHQGNMLEYLQNNPDKLPVGLNSNSSYTVVVRKPTTKS